jgi:hypothetical protein
MWTMTLWCLAASGPVVVAATIAFDAFLLGWGRTWQRLRAHPKLALTAALSTPLGAGSLLALGSIGALWQLATVLTVGAVALTAAALVRYATGVMRQSLHAGAQARIAELLAHPKRRVRALERLRHELAGQLNNERYARKLLGLADGLARASWWDELLALVTSAKLERLSDVGRGVLQVFGALACMHQGDLDAARDWLARVERPLRGQHETWRTVLEAVVTAAKGDSRRAHELVERIDEESYPLERTVALAHVLAARGETQAAREQVVRVRVELEDEQLDAFDFVPGPATPLAKEIRRGERNPFR